MRGGGCRQLHVLTSGAAVTSRRRRRRRRGRRRRRQRRRRRRRVDEQTAKQTTTAMTPIPLWRQFRGKWIHAVCFFFCRRLAGESSQNKNKYIGHLCKEAFSCGSSLQNRLAKTVFVHCFILWDHWGPEGVEKYETVCKNNICKPIL